MNISQSSQIKQLALLLKEHRLLIVALTIALAVRLLFLFFYPELNFPDAKGYRTIGEELLSHKLITNHIYMPLYPLLTAISGSKFNSLILDILISTSTVFVIYILSFKIFSSKFSAIFSALFASVYPHFIFYSISGLTETSFTFLTLLSFYFLYSKKYNLGIVTLVTGILIKPSFDLLNPFLIFTFAHLIHCEGFRKSFFLVIRYLIVYSLFMTPWWIHQYTKYNEFVRLTLADGIILYSGNNEINKTGGGIGRRNGESDVDFSKFEKIKNPIEKNNAMKDAAFNFISDNKIRFVELAGLKFVRFWRLWPYADEYSQWHIIASSLLSYGVVLILSLYFLFIASPYFLKILIPVFITFLYLTLVHMITIGSIRYRFPLEPFLIIFSGYVFKEKFGKLQNLDIYKAIKSKYLNFTFIRFLFIGVINTLFGLSIIFALKYFLNFSDIYANLFGYITGFLFSFFMHGKHTFKFNGNIKAAVLRYLLIIISAYLSNLSIVLHLIDLGVNSYISQTLGLIPYILVSYFGSKYFVYK